MDGLSSVSVRLWFCAIFAGGFAALTGAGYFLSALCGVFHAALAQVSSMSRQRSGFGGNTRTSGIVSFSIVMEHCTAVRTAVLKQWGN